MFHPSPPYNGPKPPHPYRESKEEAEERKYQQMLTNWQTKQRGNQRAKGQYNGPEEYRREKAPHREVSHHDDSSCHSRRQPETSTDSQRRGDKGRGNAPALVTQNVINRFGYQDMHSMQLYGPVPTSHDINVTNDWVDDRAPNSSYIAGTAIPNEHSFPTKPCTPVLTGTFRGMHSGCLMMFETNAQLHQHKRKHSQQTLRPRDARRGGTGRDDRRGIAPESMSPTAFQKGNSTTAGPDLARQSRPSLDEVTMMESEPIRQRSRTALPDTAARIRTTPPLSNAAQPPSTTTLPGTIDRPHSAATFPRYALDKREFIELATEVPAGTNQDSGDMRRRHQVQLDGMVGKRGEDAASGVQRQNNKRGRQRISTGPYDQIVDRTTEWVQSFQGDYDERAGRSHDQRPSPPQHVTKKSKRDNDDAVNEASHSVALQLEADQVENGKPTATNLSMAADVLYTDPWNSWLERGAQKAVLRYFNANRGMADIFANVDILDSREDIVQIALEGTEWSDWELPRAEWSDCDCEEE